MKGIVKDCSVRAGKKLQKPALAGFPFMKAPIGKLLLSGICTRNHEREYRADCYHRKIEYE